MLHATDQQIPPVLLTLHIKTQIQGYPMGYFTAPAIAEADDPQEVQMNWLAEAWNLQLTTALILEVTSGCMAEASRQKVEAGGSWPMPKALSPWGPSLLDRVWSLSRVLKINFSAPPRRAKMGAERLVPEDWDEEAHLSMAMTTIHPSFMSAQTEDSVRFALLLAKELGADIIRWRARMMDEIKQVLVDMEDELNT